MRPPSESNQPRVEKCSTGSATSLEKHSDGNQAKKQRKRQNTKDKRQKWSREDYKKVMYAFYMSLEKPAGSHTYTLIMCELQAIDRETRKLFTIYEELHPKSDVGRLYIPRKGGGRGWIAIEDCVELAVRCLEVYVHGSEERLIQATKRDKLDGLEAASVLKKVKKEKRLQDWKEKALHGQYLRSTKEVRSEQSWV